MVVEALVSICKGKPWFPYRNQIDIHRAVKLAAMEYAFEQLEDLDSAFNAVDEVVRRLK